MRNVYFHSSSWLSRGRIWYAGLLIATTIVPEAFLSEDSSLARAAYEDCQGKYKNNSMPRKDELDLILAAHKEWLSSYRDTLKQTTKEQMEDPRRANLCNANLQPPVTLKGVDLTGANLRGAHFVRNDLNGSVLVGADLTNAKMQMTKLKNVKLGGGGQINLARASLEGANLEDSRFFDSILTEVHFNL